MMRTSIASTWVFGIVMVFMVILIAYVAVQINYSRAYEVSENIIKIIEEYEGINNKSLEKIDSLMHTTHTVTGKCSKDIFQFGISGKQAYKLETKPGENYNVCVARTSLQVNGVTKCYYKTQIFFGFNLPMIGEFFKFKVTGETTGLRYTPSDSFFGVCTY